MLLDALPKPFAHFAVQGDEGRANIAAVAALGQQREGWLAWFTLDAEQIELADRVALRLSQFVEVPLRYRLSLRFDTTPPSPA